MTLTQTLILVLVIALVVWGARRFTELGDGISIRVRGNHSADAATIQQYYPQYQPRSFSEPATKGLESRRRQELTAACQIVDISQRRAQ